MKYLIIIALLLSLFSCEKEEPESASRSTDNESEQDTHIQNADTPNILLIIADDVGKDALNGFSEGTIKPNTPHIDSIRTSGLSFSNFWAYPTCSPTRSSIITGKYGYQTEVKWASDVLPDSEVILQKYINDNSSNTYATAIVGKWHLAGSSSTYNPEIRGLDYYAGLIRGQAQSYYNWLLTEDGAGTIETEYATTKMTNLAMDWINQQDKPWFMWLAYNAPHTPFHVPPTDMHNQGSLPEFVDGMEEIPYYMAAIEAMDYQIGELLDNIPQEEKDNTIIIFMGDNGSPNEVAQSPYKRSTVKGSLYQGGVNTPLFVSGTGVTRFGTDDNLITSSDLFATIASIAGVNTPEIHDSKSFKPLLTKESTIRNFQYSEKEDGTVDLWTISNGSYKMHSDPTGPLELYHLTVDPYEKINLLEETLTSEAETAKLALESELVNIRKEVSLSIK